MNKCVRNMYDDMMIIMILDADAYDNNNHNMLQYRIQEKVYSEYIYTLVNAYTLRFYFHRKYIFCH